MSQQVKKLQNGDTITKRPKTLTVKYNGELIDLDEKSFAKNYENYLSGGGGKTKNRDDWDTSYNGMLDNIRKGAESGNYYDFSLGDGRATKISYTGDDLSNEDRGLKDNGKTAKIGRLSGITGERNDSSRNAALNDLLGRTVAMGISRRDKEIETAQATTKAEAEKKEAELKAKTDAEKARTDSAFIDSFNFNKSFMPVNIDGTGMDWATLYSHYHKDPSKQAGYNKDYLSRLQNIVNGEYFNSDAGKELFKSKYNLDPDKLKATLSGVNLNSKVNYEDIYKNIGMLAPYSQLSNRTTYDKQQALELAEKNSAAGIVPKTPEQSAQEQAYAEEQAAGERVKLLENDMRFANGVNWTNFREATVNINGVPTVMSDYLARRNSPDYVETPEEAEYHAKMVQPKLDELRAAGFGENMGWNNISNKDIWSGGKEYNYNPYRSLGTRYDGINDLADVEQYKDITGMFTVMAETLNKGVGGNNTRDLAILQEAVKDSSGIPRNRYRVINKGKLLREVEIDADANGNYKMKIYNDKKRDKPAYVVNLGKKNALSADTKRNPFVYGKHDTNAKSATKMVSELNPFSSAINSIYKRSLASGGTIKNNDDLAFSTGMGPKKREISLSERVFDDSIQNTEADNYEIAALMADVVGLGASFAPGGGVVSGVAGIGSSLANARADALRGEDWGKSLAINVGLDVATAIPIAGGAAKSLKISKNVKRLIPYLKTAAGAAMLGSGSTAMLEAATKVADGDYSTENIGVLVNGFSALLGAKRMLGDSKLATQKSAVKNKVDLDVDGSKVKFDLSAKNVTDLEGKSLSAQREYISKLYKKVNPNAKEVVADASTERKLTNWFKKTETEVDIKSTQGTELKDYDTAGWFSRRAIKRQVRMNPALNPVMADGKNKFDLDAGSYKGMGNHKTTAITDESRMLPIGVTPEPIQFGQKTAKVQAEKITDKPRADISEVDGRDVKTRPASSDEVSQDIIHPKTAARDANLAKGRTSGPKSKSAKLKESIARDKAERAAQSMQTDPANTTTVKEIAPDGSEKTYVIPKEMFNRKPLVKPEPVVSNTTVKAESTANQVKQVVDKPKTAAVSKEGFSEAEVRSIRKSLGFNSAKEADLDLGAIINATTKREKNISKKIVKRAENDIKFKKWLDKKLDNYEKLDSDNINKGKFKFKEGGIVKASTGTKIKPKVKLATVAASKFPMVGSDIQFQKNLHDSILGGFDPFERGQLTNNNAVVNNINSVGNTPADKPSLTIGNRVFNPMNKPQTQMPTYSLGLKVENPLQPGFKKDILGNSIVPKIDLNTKYDYQREVIDGSGVENPKIEAGSGIKYDPLTLSELARSLANRAAHGRLDTRAEAAIATAPVQVSPTVRGDLLSRNAYDTAASRLEAQTRMPINSDASLNVAARLSANAKGGEYRAQGAIANANAIRQQEQALLQSEQQHAGARAQVANNNNASIANRNQSERINRNTRDTSMFKSLDNFWASQNMRSYGERARMQNLQDQATMYDAATERFGEGSAYAGKTASEVKSNLLTRLNDAYARSAKATDDVQRNAIKAEIEKIKAEELELNDIVTRRGFKAQLNAPLYGEKTVYLPNLFGNRGYTQGVTKHASGGRMSLAEKMALEDTRARNKARRDWLKDYKDFFKTKATLDSKENIEAQKISASFAKDALKNSK